MRSRIEAMEYSKQNPTELVEFKDLSSNVTTYWAGFFLNGEREGVFDYYSTNVLKFRDVFNSKTQHAEHLHFRPDGRICMHFFRRCRKMHGEYIEFNEDDTVRKHHFYKSGSHIEDLDYLLDAERDDAFYVTLALYEIDKEYILK